ncbi:MAG: NAD(P)/FAD-dependent oxidoreductase, partial [Candidatus Eremiobacteraeota bacterium]|nr:NAD(P)/FAD-dependent oxidoreductase [Candidatus Eremiobacteraeota bacterium]
MPEMYDNTIEVDLVIVGAGPSGMMAAGQAASKGIKVFLLEKNRSPGRKLVITGRGRCNITNTVPPDQFVSDLGPGGKFLFSTLSRFSNNDIVKFFNEQGLMTKVERGGRIFPESDDAHSVLLTMKKFIKQSGGIIKT